MSDLRGGAHGLVLPAGATASSSSSARGFRSEAAASVSEGGCGCCGRRQAAPFSQARCMCPACKSYRGRTTSYCALLSLGERTLAHKTATTVSIPPMRAVRPLDRSVRLTATLAGELVDDLAAAYSQGWFQERVHTCKRDSGYEHAIFLARLPDLALQVQGPVLQKWGFEPSMHGVREMAAALRSLTDSGPELPAWLRERQDQCLELLHFSKARGRQAQSLGDPRGFCESAVRPPGGATPSAFRSPGRWAQRRSKKFSRSFEWSCSCRASLYCGGREGEVRPQG
ncbi:unnamed protein product [Prorocentrum cordatum]|uniref:Protein C10 n=1 Tax=Prorocentrum cordatum TaxID=2364126 RepID=A0ABN9SDK3_9DINO|nr:unnamed protein product [Polarella glacialis]